MWFLYVVINSTVEIGISRLFEEFDRKALDLYDLKHLDLYNIYFIEICHCLSGCGFLKTISDFSSVFCGESNYNYMYNDNYIIYKLLQINIYTQAS